MEGGLEPGVFVSVRANIREDDRTSSKSVAAQSIDPLGGKKRKSKSGDQGPLNIIVSPLRHTRKNLEQIRDILKRYPGRSKVNLTIKDSLGHSQILELERLAFFCGYERQSPGDAFFSRCHDGKGFSFHVEPYTGRTG